MNKCKIALAQIECALRDKRANIRKAFKLLKKAANMKADVIIFPEPVPNRLPRRRKNTQLSRAFERCQHHKILQ